MTKAKTKASITTPDGSGGMAQVQDRRFEPERDWPIRFEVPARQSEDWLRYFHAEIVRRGWNSSGIAQLERYENSGSETIRTGPGGPELAIVWERKPNSGIQVRARSVGTPAFDLDEANAFFEQVKQASERNDTKQFFLQSYLCYQGLPWRGELWLDDTLRLGPPSVQYQRALIGPRIITVNSLVDGIDWPHAGEKFNLMLRELSVFLSVVMGTNVRVALNGDLIWTQSTEAGQTETEVRSVGYHERDRPAEMPVKGRVQPMPFKAVNRPDFSSGIDVRETELHLPNDIAELWRAFSRLPEDSKRQFLQAGSMWQLALSLKHEYETARFALMVVACESLKPSDPIYWKHNIYHVMESLLGRSLADSLREEWFRPQDVRNAHLHTGQFRGSEFSLSPMMTTFQDPTFDQASRELYRITRAAIIEWLSRNGINTMSPLERRKTWRRWIKDHVLWLLPVALALGFLGGLYVAIALL